MRFIKGNGRARQKRQAPHFIEHGTAHTAVGEVFKVYAFAGVKDPRSLQQSHHADLYQFVEFHVGWHPRLQMQGYAFDQSQVGQYQFLALRAGLAVHLHW